MKIDLVKAQKDAIEEEKESKINMEVEQTKK